MKEQNTPKRPATPKMNGSGSKSAAKKGSAPAKRNAPAKNSTSAPARKARTTPTPPSKKQGGLSGATILLMVITLLLAAILCCFALPHLFKSSNTTSGAPLPSSPSEEPSASLPEKSSPTSPDVKNSEKEPLSSKIPSMDPSPVINPSEASPSPSPDILPSKSPSKEPEPVLEPYLKAVTETERKREIVKKEGDYACSLNYYLPQVVLPGNEAAETAVNQGIQKGLDSLLATLKENYKKNYSGMFGDIEKEITVHFHKSEHTLSVVFYYTEIAGGGEFVEKCKSLNFDRQNGETLTVFHRLTDREAVINYVTANIDGGEHPDLDILHRQPGQGGSALCHGWYIEGQTLTLLYNGKTVDVLNPALLRVSITGGLFFNP
ncbi:MAG: hypothetical protein J6M12_04715 [Clostridia bacterium]|nr:hypothetical protein [Clostridia bacterium]